MNARSVSGRGFANVKSFSLVPAVLGLLVALVSPGAAASSVTPPWPPAVEPLLAPGTHPNPGLPPAASWAASVSCARPDTCVAFGNFNNRLGNPQTALLSVVDGRLRPSVIAKAPAHAPVGGGVTAVSCASAGNCSAVEGNGVLVTETAGRWGAGVNARLPADEGGTPAISAISCASPGNCSAVGTYFGNGGERGLLLTQRNGRWEQGVALRLPADALVGDGRFVFVNAVSCSSPGNCSAVGGYTPKPDFGAGGRRCCVLAVNEVGGVWNSGQELIAPADRPQWGTPATAIACSAPGNCSAVGDGYTLAERGGVWGPPVAAQLPENAATTNQMVALNSISCSSKLSCSAVGHYISTRGPRGLIVNETDGIWRRGLEPLLPANGTAADLESVSCTSDSNCTAVGVYDGHALAVSEVSGRWLRGTMVRPPQSLASDPSVPVGAQLVAVSCSAALRRCVAVGVASAGGGNYLILASPSPIATTAATAVIPPSTTASTPPTTSTSSKSPTTSSPPTKKAGGSASSSSTSPKALIATEQKVDAILAGANYATLLTPFISSSLPSLCKSTLHDTETALHDLVVGKRRKILSARIQDGQGLVMEELFQGSLPAPIFSADGAMFSSDWYYVLQGKSWKLSSTC